MIFSPTFGISGSSIRASLIAEGLRASGLEIAVAGYLIPDDLREKVKSYQFTKDQFGGDSLLQAANDFRPDWIFGITEDVASWVVDAALRVGSQIAFDLHGISLFEILELGREYGDKASRLRKAFLDFREIKHAHLITTATPNIFPLARFLWGGHRVVSVVGMIDPGMYIRGEGNANRQSDGKIQVFYIGNFYAWQGVNLFLDAAAETIKHSSGFKFNILGSVGKEKALKISKHPLIVKNQVSLLDRVSHDKIPEYLSMADILVIPRPFSLTNFFSFPSKLPEYMASGKLVIATDLSPHRWALTNPLCGILCRPNVKGIAQAILNYDQFLAQRLGKIAREQATKRFDLKKQCGIIRDALEKHSNLSK